MGKAASEDKLRVPAGAAGGFLLKFFLGVGADERTREYLGGTAIPSHRANLLLQIMMAKKNTRKNI